ncbi:MAG: hypothetical protein JWO98_95 [Frankiales bacterium]|nr:hypothetical protein [Frankiales bacterium]
MTGRPRRPRARYVDAVLRIVTEPSVSGHYACLRCDFTASVRGKAKTAEFARDIRTSHRATCPVLHQKGTTAA